MAKKVIDPSPIIKTLADRCLDAKGIECSILGEVIDLLKAAPEETVIPAESVRQYLLDVMQEWDRLGERKYETPNMQVYNHVRTEMDDLEAYISMHFPRGDGK